MWAKPYYLYELEIMLNDRQHPQLKFLLMEKHNTDQLTIKVYKYTNINTKKKKININRIK